MTKFDDLQFLSTFVFLSLCLFLLPISTICIKNETIRGGVSRFQFASETESESILIRAATVSRGGTFYCIFFLLLFVLLLLLLLGPRTRTVDAAAAGSDDDRGMNRSLDAKLMKCELRF